jgi:phage regulator Rha-like protein
VRGQAVMLDSDLAEVYEVETGALNRAVKRNQGQFPERYAFQLLENEWDALRCQIGILNTGRGRHRKYLPFVFTEHGAVMLASVLKSARAVQASIAVVDAFVQFRHILDANQALARKVGELAEQVGDHRRAIALIFQELEMLTKDQEPNPPKGRIGYKSNKERGLSGKRK